MATYKSKFFQQFNTPKQFWDVSWTSLIGYGCCLNWVQQIRGIRFDIMWHYKNSWILYMRHLGNYYGDRIHGKLFLLLWNLCHGYAKGSTKITLELFNYYRIFILTYFFFSSTHRLAMISRNSSDRLYWTNSCW